MRVRPPPQPRPIFVPHRHFLGQRMAHRFSVIVHQTYVTVGAARECLPVLSFALWTIHGEPSLLQLELPTESARGTASVAVRWCWRQIGWQTSDPAHQVNPRYRCYEVCKQCVQASACRSTSQRRFATWRKRGGLAPTGCSRNSSRTGSKLRSASSKSFPSLPSFSATLPNQRKPSVSTTNWAEWSLATDAQERALGQSSRRVRQHLIDRMGDRAISIADLNQLRDWIESTPEVPEGD